MICQKCNYILSGSESFCPDCGTPCIKEKEFIREPEAPSVIFSPEKEPSSTIFSDEPPRHIKPEKKEKKSKAGLYLVVVLCLVIVGAVAISAADILNFTPAIASLFSLNGENETTTEEPTTLSEYDPLSGVISPAVNYKTTVAYITGDKGQALRKGPDDYYGQIDVLSAGTLLHIVGTTNVSSDWIYVYIPEKDIYGWISGSFVSSSLSDINTQESEQSEENGETTAVSTTEENTTQN